MDKAVSVRPVVAADKAAIEELLQKLWAHDPKMLMVYGMHRPHADAGRPIRKSLAAERDGVVVGVGSLVESSLHPRLLWAAINVSEDSQRSGVGSQLYEQLESLGDRRPWLVRLSLRDEAGVSFLRKRGFYNPRSRGIMGILDTRRPEVRRWLQSIPDEVPGYSLLPLGHANNPATVEDVAQVQADVYRQYHGWNPPVTETTEAALAHYCGPNVLEGSHLCALAGDELVGAANLFRSPIDEESDVAYLAHVGVVGTDRPYADKLTQALIRRCLEWAAEDCLRVRFEADEWYAPHLALYLTAPADDIDRDFAIFINEPQYWRAGA